MLVNMTINHQEEILELAFSIAFKGLEKQQKFLQELKDIDGVEQAILVAVDEGDYKCVKL